MNTPYISVIVPVYNVEQYLSCCIDSIFAQTFTDFELLLIDDGSKDKSGKICDGYACKDSRVRVFHKENGGVSSARNLGLDNAGGEWIIFVDADDWLEKDYLLKLSEAAEDADYVISGFQYVNNDGSKIVSEYPDIITPSISAVVDDENFARPVVMNAPWGKMYKRNIIHDNTIKFDAKMILGEDNCFVNEYLCVVQKTRFIDYAGYKYRLSPICQGQKYKFTTATFVYHLTQVVKSFENVAETLHIDLTKTIEETKMHYCNSYIGNLKSLSCTALLSYIKASSKSDFNRIMALKLPRRVEIQICLAFYSPFLFYIVTKIIKYFKNNILINKL